MLEKHEALVKCRDGSNCCMKRVAENDIATAPEAAYIIPPTIFDDPDMSPGVRDANSNEMSRNLWLNIQLQGTASLCFGGFFDHPKNV